MIQLSKKDRAKQAIELLDRATEEQVDAALHGLMVHVYPTTEGQNG